jgi:hypothetical protein
MERPIKIRYLSKVLFSESAFIKTTLYQLIEAVNDAIKPGEERWVSLIVDHMLTGRVVQSDRKKPNMYMEV